MNAPPLYGLVLAGGRSTRMGSDKSVLIYHGKPQREYLFEILSRHCKKVFTSAFPGQMVPAALNPLPDDFDLKTPMSGILTAFKAFSEVAWLIVAVDMPQVGDEVIKLLLAHRDPQKAATCFYNPTERLPEPLLTIWEPAALPLLKKFVSEGNVSPRKFLSQHSIALVNAPNTGIFENVNIPGQIPS